MSKFPLCLHHELALLVLDDSKGTFEGSMYQYGFAGAIMSELLLQGYIEVTDDKDSLVSVKVNKPTGDSIMDEVLDKVAESAKPRTLQYWVSQIAGLKNLKQRIADQLCELGIVSQQEGKVLWLFTRKIWPELDGSYEDAIRKRMADAMFSESTQPDDRTAVLIAFANSSGVMNTNFASVELRQHAARVKTICEGKLLAAGATQDAIAAVQAAIMCAVIASTVATSVAASATARS
jgi:hypothetical protein